MDKSKRLSRDVLIVAVIGVVLVVVVLHPTPEAVLTVLVALIAEIRR